MKNSLKHNLTALLINALGGIFLALIFGFSPLIGAMAVNLVMIVIALIKVYYIGRPILGTGYAFSGLFKEVWLAKLMENFYPDGSFLLRSQDMTAFVENNTINLADAGVDPDVLVNNTTYPLGITERTDVPLALPLDYFDTVNTVVRNATSVQLAYNKLESVIRQHRLALYKKNLQKAAHAWGPNANSALTPVITVGGSILDTIIDAEAAFNSLEVPADGRIIVLCPTHKAMIRKENKVLFNEVFGKNGTNDLYGFVPYVTSVTPRYNNTTSVKVPFGTAAAGTDIPSSLFYSEYEVMRADGEYDMYSRLKDPEARGDIIGFQKRFVGLSIRNKYNGAIIG